jgi:hypothetical protein
MDGPGHSDQLILSLKISLGDIIAFSTGLSMEDILKRVILAVGIDFNSSAVQEPSFGPDCLEMDCPCHFEQFHLLKFCSEALLPFLQAFNGWKRLGVYSGDERGAEMDNTDEYVS